MDTIDRIRALAKERDISQNSICRKIGKGNSYFSDKKRTNGSIPDEVLFIIAERLDTSVAYLKGLTDDPERRDRHFPFGAELADMPLVKFPVVGSIAAGYNCCAIEEYTGDYAYFPSSELTAPAEEYFVLRVKGDSMYPKLLDGDLVLVRRKTNIESGKIAVVLYNGEEATLKKVNYVYGQDWLELLPINPEYKAKRIEGAELEQCRVLGEVVKLQRDL